MLTRKTNKAPAPSGLLTTMFTDIVGSTQLKSRVPGETSARRDAAYRTEIKGPHDAVVLTCVQEFEGYVINSTGDGYCVTFVDAEEAVLCALQVQERLRSSPIPTPLGPLQVRIGLHTGMTGATSGDYTAVPQNQSLSLSPGAPIKSMPAQPKRPEQRPAKHKPIFWQAAALMAVLLAVLGYFLRTRLAPLPPPPLPAGSVWSGSFRFLPPIQNYGGSADLSITQRTGDHFEGVYATENRQYRWRVNGTNHGDQLHWEFTQVLKSPGAEDAVGKAYVEATVKGDQITGLFHEYNSPGEMAALQLRRIK